MKVFASYFYLHKLFAVKNNLIALSKFLRNMSKRQEF